MDSRKLYFSDTFRISVFEFSKIPRKSTFRYSLKCSFNYCRYVYRKLMCSVKIEGNIFHLPKIHRSVLRKITIDLLHFWDVYDVNLWEKKISAEVRPIYAEKMSLYNFIILRKKQCTQMKAKQLKKEILNQ